MERTLIEQAGRGDPNAFSNLIKDHANQIYAQIYPIAKTRNMAMDWTVETFLRAWHGIGLFQFDVPFDEWLSSLADDICASHAKHRRKKDGVAETYGEAPEDEILRNVMQAIRRERSGPLELLKRVRFTLIALVIAALLLLGSRLGLFGGGKQLSASSQSTSAPAAPQVSAAFQAGPSAGE